MAVRIWEINSVSTSGSAGRSSEISFLQRVRFGHADAQSGMGLDKNIQHRLRAMEVENKERGRRRCHLRCWKTFGGEEVARSKKKKRGNNVKENPRLVRLRFTDYFTLVCVGDEGNTSGVAASGISNHPDPAGCYLALIVP